jgi:nucleoside-diphosphate-sugar epimerase
MKILVIGCSGFIGQFLVKNLLNQKHTVVGLDINPPSDDLGDLYTFHDGDLLSHQDMKKAATGVDLIISLAAKHHDFGISRDEYFEVNEGGTRILLECASKCNIKNIIFYSTVAVYGTQNEPSTEETTPQPDNYYGQSKLAGEKVIGEWVQKDNKLQVIIIRPTVIFGPNNYANVYNLIDKIYRKKFIFVGNGKNIKSVAYVENLVDATAYLITKLKPGIQIFNYSDEPQMTITETVETISAHMPHDIPKIRLPLWFAVTFGSIFDFLGKISGKNFPITAARMKKFATSTHHTAKKIREHGFVQRIPTKEGFRRMIEWYLKTQVK